MILWGEAMIMKSVPNIFTLGNLFLGMIAIFMAIDGKYSHAALMVIVAMLLDGLDGRIARALNAQSEFGKELDSLSDVISFGVAPAVIMYFVAFQEANPALAWTVTAVFPMCGALRLARFNVVNGTSGYFTGLPIPAAGSVLAILSLFHQEIPLFSMAVATLMLSYLMISSLKYPNFKRVGLPKKAVWIAPLVVIVAVVVAVRFPAQLSKLLFVPLVLYAMYGMKHNFGVIVRKRRVKRRHSEESNSYRNSEQ